MRLRNLKPIILCFLFGTVTISVANSPEKKEQSKVENEVVEILSQMRYHEVYQDALEYLKSSEGFSSNLYLCPANKLTIGYGHQLKEGESFPKEISKDEAETLLIEDFNYFIEEVSRDLDLDPIHHPEKVISLSLFAYNVGLGAYKRSTLRKRVLEGDLDKVKVEFMRWHHISGVPNSHLKSRRKFELALLQEGFNSF